MKKIRNEKAITLIALVITIIVLLILAGVAISMLAGDNGILRKAVEAKEKTETASVLEQLQLAVYAAQSNGTGEIDKEILRTEIEKVGYTGGEITDLPIDFSINGKHYTILEDGVAKEAVWYYTDDTKKKVTNGTKEGTVKIGTKVNYTPGDERSYESPKEKNGYVTKENQRFESSSYSGEWAILGVSGGQVIIMPTENIQTIDNKNFYLGPTSNDESPEELKNSQTAYINAVEELDKISDVYGHGEGATGGRSIRVEDINRVTGYNPEEAKYHQGQIDEYGNKVTYYWQGENSAPYYNGTNGANGTLTSQHKNGFYWYDGKSFKYSERDDTATTGNKKEITTFDSDYYYYWAHWYLTDGGSDESELLFGYYDEEMDDYDGKEYWIGSRYVNSSTNRVHFGVRYNCCGQIDGCDLFYSDGNYYYSSFGVRPVVSLKSDIQLNNMIKE